MLLYKEHKINAKGEEVIKVAVIGSRNCQNVTVDEVISYIPLNCSKIISGGAQGIDQLAKNAAVQLNIDYEEILPDYKKYGKSAPLKRNEEIAQNSYLVLAFWDLKSKGTAHIIDFCIKNYIPFKIIPIQ